jgi:DNA (cytosine-5)-methyltransferase 1
MTKTLTVEDISKKLKITEQYTRKLMRTGKINSISQNRTWFTTQRELESFLETGEYVVNPDDRVRISDTIPEIVALSFFSGGMGLDIGMGNEGIHPLLACEINKEARATIVTNNHDIGLVGDIWECTPEKLRTYAKLPENRKIDIIFGGPPCQAFSTAGNRKGFEDARGNVFMKYLDVIGEMTPTYAVIENVRGLQTTEAILENTNGRAIKGGALHYALEKLKSFGYTVSFELYNSANFGAPQKRERFVIIAKLGNKKVPYLTPTNAENGEFGLPMWNTLRDAIGDIQGKEMTYSTIPSSRIEWFRKIPEGGNWKSLSDDEQKLAMGKKYFMGGGKTGFLRRVSFDQPSPTLVTVPTMPATDLIHPTELRPLSIEEYARIQGFPDDWKFRGKIMDKYRQIGNAVPIKLGEAIGRTLFNDIHGIEHSRFEGFNYSRYRNTSDLTFPSLYNQNLEKALQNNNEEQLSLSI